MAPIVNLLFRNITCVLRCKFLSPFARNRATFCYPLSNVSLSCFCHAWKADQWEESLPTLISVQRQTEMDISLLDSLTFHCENFGKTKYGTKPHTMKLYSFVYRINSTWSLWMSYRYTEIQRNEWDSVQTYSCLPTTIYQPPTDHLPTAYWPLTDHLPTTNRPLTWPLTDHLPTTYQPLMTTYRPPTDHLPTTFLQCSLFTIT